MQVGLRNLDVIAEDSIESNFQRADARALAFAYLDRGEIRLAVLRQRAQFVKLRVVAVSNDAAVSKNKRWLITDGFVQQFTDVGKQIESLI